MKLFLCLLIVTVASATNLTSAPSKKYVECKPFEHPRCLKWNNKTQSCYVIDCWEYSLISGCEKAGKPWAPAIILQSIPFTGVFGSGFGNIGRWDIFGMYMAIVFGPVVLACIVGCAVMCCTASDESNVVKCTMSCFSCLYGIALVFFWIWGIIQIAGKHVEAPWTSHDGGEIMCPLV